VACPLAGRPTSIFADNDLAAAVIRKFRITAADGKIYETSHYNLSAIITVGYKVNSERAVQFRKRGSAVVTEYTVKGCSRRFCFFEHAPKVINPAKFFSAELKNQGRLFKYCDR